MTTRPGATVLLAEMRDGEEGDFFALLTSKEELTTRDGKPYYKVAFRDAEREVSFPIWQDSVHAAACREEWTPGEFYKLRATFRETNYGPQLEIRKLRPVADADYDDGFDPLMCQPQSRFDPQAMFGELLTIVDEEIADASLAALVKHLLSEHREDFCRFPAARRNHHAYVAGLLEHTLSVTRTSVFLAKKYQDYYPDMQPPLSKDLVVAGAILHDIGKLREYEVGPEGAQYGPAGHLIGHILQGRDLVREAATVCPVDAETLLRLEHVIVAHQRLPEWGSPKPPLTPEATIVHYADDLDAKYHMVYRALGESTGDESFTSAQNVLRQRLFRGLAGDS
ncbi:MAG: HD domain-containing protein [Planctomycetota bacterium]|nr:MAG: HD domain-containing protein [Planctomycetota bacterium]REJ88716.1 MAG: HD domain-containing protein [Planctomycetota bacterium]